MKKKFTVTKLLIAIFLTFSAAQFLQAQVTTGSMTGVVRSTDGTTLPGATVVVTHVPTGTTHHTTTSVTGNYNIQGMRAGGPYRLEVSFMGFQTQTIEDITVLLGEVTNINVTLGDGALALEGVTIVGESRFISERTGSAQNISNQEIHRLPTISRNITDVARLSPHSTGGISLGGRDRYMTNVSIDGANFNSNFGLSSMGAMPGVFGDPISMEAIEELQIVIAPFDVRQSNFTAGGINAVTRSGTNQVTASAYAFFRNQNMSGRRVGDLEIPAPESSSQIYGFTVGAPIIRDRLFVFLSGEMARDNTPRPASLLRAQRPGDDPDTDPNIHPNVRYEDMMAFSNFLREQFSYETGGFEGFSDNMTNYRVLARLDWNINNNHRVSFRYNFSRSSVEEPVNWGAAPTVVPAIQSGTGRHARTGGMSFENSRWSQDGILHSITGELNSRFSDRLSNTFLIAYTYYDQPRSTNSDIFPFIDIMGNPAGANVPLMSAGMDLFTYQNRVQNNTLIITNNATLQHGRHTLTAGLSFEYQYFSNAFFPFGTGYFRYSSLQAFMNHAQGIDNSPGVWNPNYHPLAFGFTYGLDGRMEPKAELGFGQFAAYIQNEWSVTDDFRLTMGLRMDLPMYFDGAVDNPATHGMEFRDGQTIDMGSWPDARPLWSPRVGFNWNVNGDRSLTLRGGTGIFTGRIPFVWFINQPLSSQMLWREMAYSAGADASPNANHRAILAQIPFTANPRDLLGMGLTQPNGEPVFPMTGGLGTGSSLAVIDNDFRLPQVWRTSLSADIRLPLNMMLTLEAMYARDINAVAFENINIQDPTGIIREGSNERDFFETGRQPVNSGINNVVKLTNTDRGQSYSLSAQLRLPNWNGFSGSLAYTFSRAEEAFFRTGNNPQAAWGNRISRNSLNGAEMGFTVANTPHRIMTALSYHIEYGRNFSTTISLFYIGRSGNAFSWLYNGIPNGFGTGTYLAFLPKYRTDVEWQSDADWYAFQRFVELNPEIERHLGTIPGRFTSNLPWNNRLDLRIAQEFRFNSVNRVHRLTITADILNFTNLLNPNWGINKVTAGGIYGFPILNFIDRNDEGKAIVSMRRIGNQQTGDFVTTHTQNPSSQWTGSTPNTWAIQIGVRYSF